MLDCGHIYIEGNVKERDSCHSTGKYRGSAQRDSNIKIKLNLKISIVIDNLKNYDSHIIMQQLDKFSFKINPISHRLKKYMSFNINNNFFFFIVHF